MDNKKKLNVDLKLNFALFSLFLNQRNIYDKSLFSSLFICVGVHVYVYICIRSYKCLQSPAPHSEFLATPLNFSILYLIRFFIILLIYLNYSLIYCFK